MNDPNMNRPGYKKTKLGWIPEEWHTMRVDQAGEVKAGRQRSPHAVGALRNYLRVANVLEGFIDTSDVLSMPFTEDEHRTFRLKEGDILLNEGQSLELVGRSAIYKGVPKDCCFQNTLIRFRPVDLGSVEYFKQLFSAYLHSGKFAKVASRTTSIAHLGSTKFGRMLVPAPPLPEQQKIAAILTTCDEVIEKTSALIEAKQRQKKALMQQLLTGKKRLPGFKGVWVRVKLGDLFAEISRPVEWDDEAHYNLISVRRRSGGLFYREGLKGKDILTKVMNTTHVGDFLISKMQVVHGAMAMTTSEFDGGHVSGSYITLVAKDKAPIYMPFFDYLSRTNRLYHLAFISSYGVVIEKMTFNLSDFLDKTIFIPPSTEEQARITEVLKTCEVAEAALAKKLSALHEQKKSLMQKLLTGQIRVTLKTRSGK